MEEKETHILALAITFKAFKSVLFAVSEINNSLFQVHLLPTFRAPSMFPPPFQLIFSLPPTQVS